MKIFMNKVEKGDKIHPEDQKIKFVVTIYKSWDV